MFYVVGVVCFVQNMTGYVFGSFFFFKQKTAYEMRISDWSSDVCSSDLQHRHGEERRRRIVGRSEDQPDEAPDETGEGAGFEQDVLIENAPAQCLDGQDRKSVV